MKELVAAALFSRAQVEVRAVWGEPQTLMGVRRGRLHPQTLQEQRPQTLLAGSRGLLQPLSLPPTQFLLHSSPCFRYRGGVYSQQTGASFLIPAFTCECIHVLPP